MLYNIHACTRMYRARQNKINTLKPCKKQFFYIYFDGKVSVKIHYNNSVRIMTSLLTPLMLCALILYMSSRTYSLKSTPNYRFFKKLFHVNFTSKNLCQISVERKSPKKYYHIFVSLSDRSMSDLVDV